MEPVQIGSKFVNASPYNGSVGVLITPANNTNGVIIRTASIDIGAIYSILTTGPKAPTGYFDLAVPVVLSCRGTEAGQGFPGAAAALPYPILIPAGYGLWYATGGGTGHAYVTYDPVA